MTHNDIYTKFMIEYDKANIASSYPSLTDYEIATLLDKAYLALIALKVTGNNPRKANFELDTKAIEDLRPLITTSIAVPNTKAPKFSSNELVHNIPDGFLYYIKGMLRIETITLNGTTSETENISLMNHSLAEKFIVTDTNLPWIPNPVAFLEGDYIHILVDPYKFKNLLDKNIYSMITHIKQPNKFLNNGAVDKSSKFELSDTMAEELINLAIVFATNTVESSRLQSQTSLLTLES